MAWASRSGRFGARAISLQVSWGYDAYMHDTTGDATAHPTSHIVATGQMLPVATAAAALGITSDAIRARIRRGKMQGEKRDGGWFVFVPDSERPGSDATKPDTSLNTHDIGPDTEGRVTTPNATVVTPPVVDLAPLAGVIRYQEEIIERQSQELAQLNAAAAMWQERARSLEGQLIALNPGETTPSRSSEASGSPRSDDQPVHGLRAWWRRLWGF